MRGLCDAGDTQEGIEQVKEGVASAPQPRVHLLAEGSQRFPFGCVHNRKDELSSLFLSTPDSMPLCYGLKCKLSGLAQVVRRQGMKGASTVEDAKEEEHA